MKLVPGDGPRNARVAFIGEAPGKWEIDIGKPFQGMTGRMLKNDIIPPSRLRVEDCYFDNICQYRKHDKWNPEDLDIVHETPGLRRRLLELPNLQLVVAVGGAALKALSCFKKPSIEQNRGSIFKSPLINKPCMPILHPSFIKQGNYEMLHPTISDVKKAVWLWSHDFPKAKPRSHFVIYDPDLAQETIKKLSLEETISLDIETSLECIGLAPNADISYTFPLQSFERIVDKQHLLRLFREHIFVRGRKFITQNGLFEKVHIEQRFNIPASSWEIYIDTMYLHQLLWSELPHSLEFLCSSYLHVPVYKFEGRQFRPGVDSEMRLFIYNGKDCCYTFDIAMKMKREAERLKQWNYYQEILNPAIDVLFNMYKKGIKVDREKVKELKKEFHRKETIARLRLIKASGSLPNPRSRTHLREFLEDQQIPEKDWPQTKAGNVKTDERAIIGLLSKYPTKNSLIRLVELRKILTEISGFTNFRLDENDRYHAFFKFGPITGRLSSEGIGGPQLQNIPASVRRVFVAEADKILISGDYKQADARALAYAAQEENLIRIFESEDPDIHSRMAAALFSIPREEISKHGPYAGHRQTTKIVTHGTNYRMGVRTLVTSCRLEGIPMTEKKATAYRDKYLKLFPRIETYWKDVEQQLYKDRTVYSLLGRRHIFLGDFENYHIFTKATGTIPQATVGSVALLAMIRLSKLLPPGASLLLQVHDELVVECYKKDAKLVKKIMEDCMSVELEAHGRKFIIPIDFKIGLSWGLMYDWTDDGAGIFI